MRFHKPATLSFAVLLLLGSGAAGADSGFYAGGGAGRSSVDVGAYDDEDSTFSLFGGYQFTANFALEGGYLDLGEIESGANGANLDADSFHLVAVGMLPLSDAFALYAKAGVHRWNAETALPVLDGNDSGSDPTYGVGAQYRFNERFSLRLDLSRFELDEVDADVAQLQARFDF